MPLAVTRVAATRLCLAIALLTTHGCVSEAVLSAWDDSARISSLGLRARSLDSSRVEIAWRARASSTLQFSSGVIELDSKLEGCEQVETLAGDSDGIVLLDATDERIFTLGHDGGIDDDRTPAPHVNGECQLLLRIARPWDMPGPSVTLLASTQRRDLGRARISAPRNPLWLGLMPASAAADVVLFPLYLCTIPSPDNLCIAVLDSAF